MLKQRKKQGPRSTQKRSEAYLQQRIRYYYILYAIYYILHTNCHFTIVLHNYYILYSPLPYYSVAMILQYMVCDRRASSVGGTRGLPGSGRSKPQLTEMAMGREEPHMSQ